MPWRHSDEEVAAVLNVLQDGHALDTVLVCALMDGEFSDFSAEEIAEVIKARDSLRHKSFKASYVDTVWNPLRYSMEAGPELFGAVSRCKRWVDVQEKRYDCRERDESDQEENCALAIWNEAKATLENLRKNTSTGTTCPSP